VAVAAAAIELLSYQTSPLFLDLSCAHRSAVSHSIIAGGDLVHISIIITQHKIYDGSKVGIAQYCPNYHNESTIVSSQSAAADISSDYASSKEQEITHKKMCP